MSCDYCGLEFSGPGYSAGGGRFCCYGCYLVSKITGATGEEGVAAWIIVRLGIGAFLSMNVMMISLVLYTAGPGALGSSAVHGLRWAMLILSTPAIAILGGPFFRSGLRDIARFRLGTDVLIGTGAFAAYLVSAAHVIAPSTSSGCSSVVSGSGAVYFDTATMLLLIVTVGRLLEASAKSRTSRSIREMMVLTPDTARVVRDGQELEIAADELCVGDVMLVRPGERIPTDGVIVSGECFVEESAFTGEATPRACSPGDRVHGGSINRDGVITVRATAVGSDSLAARIQTLVERARRERAPIERLAERAAGVFVPVVWLVAAGAAAYWTLVRHDPARAGLSALAALVVACPCALGLATPMATCLAIGKAARRGVLIRSGEVLERLPRIARVFFDKTGTLTRNQLSVAEVRTIEGLSEDELLAWAAPLEAASGHLLGEAIAREAASRGIALGRASEVRVVPGFGVEGSVTIGPLATRPPFDTLRYSGLAGWNAPKEEKTQWVAVGSLDMMARAVGAKHSQTDFDDSLGLRANASPLSAAYVAWDGTVRGVILLSDEPRPEAADLISALNALDIRSAVVSGDREGPTQRLADAIGVEDVFSGCTPEDKAEIVARSYKLRVTSYELGKGRPFPSVPCTLFPIPSSLTAFGGDGINDAPALARADVGIAVGCATDLARESSDVTLLGGDLSRIAEVIELGRATHRIIRWNLVWAFGYNAVAVGLACMGFVHPLIAALAMLGSSMCVIANSMRITKL